MTAQYDQEFKEYSNYCKSLGRVASHEGFDLLEWLHSKAREDWLAGMAICRPLRSHQREAEYNLRKRVAAQPTTSALDGWQEPVDPAKVYTAASLQQAADIAAPKTLAAMDDAERKSVPLLTGVIDYFLPALIEIAKVSKAGNDQHNPGEPLHWSKGKSTDHGNTAMRHLSQHGTLDKDGMRHTAKAAWRLLAMLTIEVEAEQHGMTYAEYTKALESGELK